MSNVLTDNFTDSSGTNLTSHTPDSGGSWAKFSPNTGDIVVSDANRARLNSVSTDAFYNHSDDVGPDLLITWVVRVVTVIEQFLLLAFRMDTGTGNHYKVEIRPSTDILRLVANGGTGQLASVGFDWQADTTYTIKVFIAGSSIRVLVDDVEKINVSNSEFTAAGKIGLADFSSGTVSDAAGTHTDSIVVDDEPVTIHTQSISGTSANSGDIPTLTVSINSLQGSSANSSNIIKNTSKTLGASSTNTGFLDSVKLVGGVFTESISGASTNLGILQTIKNPSGSLVGDLIRGIGYWLRRRRR